MILQSILTVTFCRYLKEEGEGGALRHYAKQGPGTQLLISHNTGYNWPWSKKKEPPQNDAPTSDPTKLIQAETMVDDIKYCQKIKKSLGGCTVPIPNSSHIINR